MNQFEAYLSQMGTGLSSHVLMADFDDGSRAHDGFGFFYGLDGLGLGLNEVSTAPGDSGGPAFINGRIAGITSFGVRLAFEDGRSSDIDGSQNFSFGEFNGFTDASAYADWIYNNRSIPEPGTLGLLACGLLAGVVVRFRAQFRSKVISMRSPLEKKLAVAVHRTRTRKLPSVPVPLT